MDFEVHPPEPDPTFVKKNITADALGLFIRIFLQVLQHMKCDFFLYITEPLYSLYRDYNLNITSQK